MFLRCGCACELLATLQAIIASIARSLSSLDPRFCSGSCVGCRMTSRCWRHACLYRTRRPALPEIPQQRRAPAMARFRIRDHGAQLLVRDALLALAFFLDETPLFDHIAHTEEQHALARQTIATCAPGFLIIPFDVLRQIVVNDKPDVRLVNTQAERDCGCDYACIIAQECFLIPCPFSRFHPGVIR